MQLHENINKIAVIGTFGCGKSTVVDDIKEELKDSKASVQIIEEYPKKLFLSAPYNSLPTEQWPKEWYQEIQEKTIRGVIEEEKDLHPQKKLSIVESYWANILPYTILNFGEGHCLTSLVRKKLEETLDQTFYIYLSHQSIPLDTLNRHADISLRNIIAHQIKDILTQNKANYTSLDEDKNVRKNYIKELSETILHSAHYELLKS
ncbi:MAG: hypothetical protein ACK4NC_03770 [Candidatus Gracilibacteria bacterium]